MSEDTIRNMRARSLQCRNLAKTVGDPRASKILMDMADEIEADVRRMEAEASAKPGSKPGTDEASEG